MLPSSTSAVQEVHCTAHHDTTAAIRSSALFYVGSRHLVNTSAQVTTHEFNESAKRSLASHLNQWKSELHNSIIFSYRENSEMFICRFQTFLLKFVWYNL